MSSSTAKRISRVLSLRGPRDRHRSRSRTRTPSLPDFLNLQTLDDSKRKLTKEEEKKVHELRQQLVAIGLTNIPDTRIEYAIKTKSSEGDVKKALRLIVTIEDAIAGVLTRYDPSVKMLGAENREKVTCYLDTLLFAMFGKSDVFEAMLYKSYEDEPRRRLVTLLRIWVNLLRSGRLITVDLMQKIQESLADCGWPDAARLQQQDVSEAFCFITDQLNLPLLTLQTDLFHSGKIDAQDDHKFITERMLDVAIPEDTPAGQAITLELCLEEYFNNRVEVRRHLLRKGTISSITAPPVDKGSPAVHIEYLEQDSEVSTPLTDQAPALSRPMTDRQRTKSIFSDRKVEIIEGQEAELGPASPMNMRQRTNSTVRKEVTMPAWQFLNLIPWYTGMEPSNDSHITNHFSSKRPMLGICLKRYKVSVNGTSSRLNTHIDIPLEMSSPHFASGDGLEPEDDDLPTGNFKLSLQSVICHRGHAVDSGHYIALLRANTNKRASFVDALENHENAEEAARQDTWLCFDDLASERVRRVDIVKSLRDESPYILFYRVQPIDDNSGADSPPPYSESSESFDVVDHKLAALDADNRISMERLSSALPSPRISLDSSLDRTTTQPSAESLRRDNLPHKLDSASSGTSVRPQSGNTEINSQILSPPPPSTKSIPRKDSNSKSSNSSDKRKSGTWSLIAAKLKGNSSSGIIVTEEVIEDTPLQIAASPVDNLPEDPNRLKVSPEKDKKKRKDGLERKSRTSSMNELAEKMKLYKSRTNRPERDCDIM